MEEVRPRSDINASGANLHVNVRNLKDNKMWIGNGRTSCSSCSYHPPPPKRHHTKLPMSSYEPEKPWWNDPEMKRKCRVAKYKLYAAEGRFKCSLKAGIRWLKFRCIKIVRTL